MAQSSSKKNKSSVNGKGTIITVIMPTLNSGKTIEKSLVSIRKQKFPQKQVEILVIDGGSTDQTLPLAKKYNCRVLPNPKIQQEYAKHIGMLKGKGRFAMFLDSDEVLSSPTAIRNRVEILSNNPEIKIVLTGGYKKPAGFSSINDYINVYSDPFAYFMYGITSEADHFLGSLSRRSYVKKEADTPVARELSFKKKSIRPLVDISAGNTIDLQYFKKRFAGRVRDVSIVPRAFYLITNDKPRFAVLKNDHIIHYSADSFRKFFNKIKWRVLVNIHYQDIPGTGFSNREEFQPLWFRLKKFLFPLYSFTVVIPLIDSIVKSIAWRAPILLMHMPLAFYTSAMIVYYYFLKLIRIKPRLKSYGSQEKVLKL